MASIRKNFFYNSILTTANYIFPFLTYPYVTRVLGVSNIGLCNYVDSIINYFMIFSMLGIAVVGIREVVGAKHDRALLNRTFSTLFFINLASTVAVIAVLIAAINLVPKFHENSSLLYVGVFKLLGNLLLVEWLFKGLEDFKYITMRTILVKCLYVVCVFIFVRDEGDYGIYYVLMVLMVVINSIINWIYARKYVRLTFSLVPCKGIVKSLIVLGIYILLTNMYVSFNVAFLGYRTDDVQVGYYTTATKICLIILALFGAFTHVMLPRMTDILKNKDYRMFKQLLSKSMRVLYAFSVPMIIFTVIFADKIILLIAGPGYEGAVLPMQICMPLLLIIGYEQIIITDGLMPMKKDKAIFVNSTIGAAVALLCCFLLVDTLKSVGAALVWTCSEIAVTISASCFIHKYVGVNFPWKAIFISLGQNIPLLAMLLAIKFFIPVAPTVVNTVLMLTVCGLILLTYCFVLQYYIIKEEMVVGIIDKKLSKFRPLKS